MSADKTGDQELASEGPTQEDGSGFATRARRSAAVLAQALRPSPRPADPVAAAQRVAAPAATATRGPAAEVTDEAADDDHPPPLVAGGAASPPLHARALGADGHATELIMNHDLSPAPAFTPAAYSYGPLSGRAPNSARDPGATARRTELPLASARRRYKAVAKRMPSAAAAAAWNLYHPGLHEDNPWMDTARQEDEGGGGIGGRAPSTPPGAHSDDVPTSAVTDPLASAGSGARALTTWTTQARAKTSGTGPPHIEGRARTAAPPLVFYTLGTPQPDHLETPAPPPHDVEHDIRRPTAAELDGVSMEAIRLLFCDQRVAAITRARTFNDNVQFAAVLRARRGLPEHEWPPGPVDPQHYAVFYGFQASFHQNLSPREFGRLLGWATPFDLDLPGDISRAPKWAALRTAAADLLLRLETAVPTTGPAACDCPSLGALFNRIRQIAEAYFRFKALALEPLLLQLSDSPLHRQVKTIIRAFICQACDLPVRWAQLDDFISARAALAPDADIVEARDSIARPFLMALRSGQPPGLMCPFHQRHVPQSTFALGGLPSPQGGPSGHDFQLAHTHPRATFPLFQAALVAGLFPASAALPSPPITTPAGRPSAPPAP